MPRRRRRYTSLPNCGRPFCWSMRFDSSTIVSSCRLYSSSVVGKYCSANKRHVMRYLRVMHAVQQMLLQALRSTCHHQHRSAWLLHSFRCIWPWSGP